MTLSKKILIGFIACSLVLFGVSTFSFRNSEQIVESGEWVSHTNQLLFEFEQVLIAAIDAETGVRGFVVAGKETFLEPYADATKRIWDHTDRVQELSSDNPAQQKNIEEMRIKIAAHLDFLDLCIKTRREGFEKAQELMATGEGKRKADEVRRLIAKSKDIENKLLVEREQRNKEDIRNFNIVFASLIGVIIIVLVFMYFIITANLNALKRAEIETATKNWLLTGNTELSNRIQGEKDVRTLATEVIGQLTQYMKAQVGALHIVENGVVEQVAGYACHPDDLGRRSGIGEGLVGQAALERAPLLLKSIPENYLRISSGLGRTTPRNIILYPFMYSGGVKGVIEIGSINDFSDSDMQLLKLVDENIGIGINSAQSRVRLRELLEETQRQGEELQQQQEELQQSNEELEAQTQQLKQQQEELQQTNEELEEQTQAVEQKNAALEVARRDVEAKAEQLEVTSRYKSEFLANMSHELRTPLNSLLILSNDLAKNKKGNLTATQVESAGVIAKSGYDLLNLINDILDLSKVEAGKMELEIERVSAQAIAADLRTSLAHMAKEKGLDFQVEVDDTAPQHVHTDPQRLGQVLKNLVSNAIKFTRNGAVTISIRGNAQGGFNIAVQDTGIGIPAAKQRIIFEAFQQADGGTSRTYGGTGLGLSISRELAKLLGGAITLQSTEGVGSTFTLSLPTHAPAQAPPLPETAAQPAEPRSQQFIGYPSIPDERATIEKDDPVVLIIEDDNTFATVLSRQAKRRGFKFLAASTGEDGLDLLRKFLPKAVLLDMDLPGIDGNTVLKEIKGDPLLRHIPVHILSVNDRSLEAIRTGAVQYLVKPVSEEQLDGAFTRIEDLMERKMKNLLIVEDDPAQRMAIRTLVGNGDVHCIEAESAKRAMELLGEHKIDCVVLDIGLPDATGFELLKRMQATLGDAIPPVIVYTGKELTRQQNDELRQYAETIIVKGIRSEERLLDETALFLHRTVKDLPAKKRDMIMDLHDAEAVFQGRTVLLTDDDMRNVFALTKVLAGKGFHVVRAENGRVALDLLEAGTQVDIVLMDIMMPEMDGYTCMREIRKHARFAHLPILALTAKAMKEDRKKCIDAGANDYITKPVDVDRLFSLMRIWLTRNRS